MFVNDMFVRALNGVAVHVSKDAFAAVILRKAENFSNQVPGFAVAAKHFSKKDMAFIAAAYAIPLPGTALIAAAIIGSRNGYRYLQSRLKTRMTPDARNG